MARSTEVTRREIGILVAGASLIALAMRWPLPLHLGSEVPKDLGDPMGQAWQLAWIGHALIHQPDAIFQANIWWPLHNSLATTDILFGYAPATLIGSGPDAAVVRYDLLFLFAYALAFVGAYLLARELGVGPAGAAVAGAAFAYAPWRLGHDPHLNLLSSGGIPLSLFLLLRGYRRNSAGMVLAGWLLATWQLLLGIGLGIQLAYLLVLLGVIAAIYWYRRRPPLRRGVVLATALGTAALLLTTIWLSRPYLEVREDYPLSGRTLETVAAFSPGPRAFLRAPPGNLVWGAPPRGGDETVGDHEFTLFPGAVIMLLAFVGLLSPVYPKRLRLALAVAILGLAVLSLGYNADRGVPIQPYKLVFEYLPGWDSIRVPTRLNTLTSLALALLAAAGATYLVGRSRDWAGAARRKHGRIVPSAVGTVLVVAVLLEGSGFHFRDGGLRAPELATVPSLPTGQLGAPEPQFHLPSSPNTIYPFWSTEGFPRIVNGWGGIINPIDLVLYATTTRFPDSASVAILRRQGVRTVVLHRDLLAGTELGHAPQRPVKGLPLNREVRGDVILYHLNPLTGNR